jgi:YbbR domain-containing protein
MEQKNTWLIKICCIIAAFALWLYVTNVENNNNSQPISVPVTLVGEENVTSQKLKILPPSQPYTVTLHVRGSLSDIAIGKDQFKVVADLSEFQFSKGTKNIPVRLERQPANVSVLNSEGLYVSVSFDTLVEKTLPVKININGKVKDGYYAPQNYYINPTDVVVSGAAKFVDQVNSVETTVDLKSAEKDLGFKLPLKALDSSGKEVKNVDISPSYVDVSIAVKKIKTVNINVKTKGNVSGDLALKSLQLVPDKVDIAGGDNINDITSLDTEPLDLSTLTPNKTVVLKIIVPDGVILTNSDGTVKVKAIMDKIIQKNFSLDIGVKNLNDSYTAALNNQSVSLIISGPESKVNALTNADFNCYIDLNSIVTEGEHTVPVSLTIPDGITKISQNPQSVIASVKKKASQTTTGSGGQ